MIYALDVLGFSIMDAHFYLLIEMSPGDMFVNEVVRRRFMLPHKKGAQFPYGKIDHL